MIRFVILMIRVCFNLSRCEVALISAQLLFCDVSRILIGNEPNPSIGAVLCFGFKYSDVLGLTGKQ